MFGKPRPIDKLKYLGSEAERNLLTGIQPIMDYTTLLYNNRGKDPWSENPINKESYLDIILGRGTVPDENRPETRFSITIHSNGFRRGLFMYLEEEGYSVTIEDHIETIQLAVAQ